MIEVVIPTARRACAVFGSGSAEMGPLMGPPEAYSLKDWSERRDLNSGPLAPHAMAVAEDFRTLLPFQPLSFPLFYRLSATSASLC